MSDKYFNFSDVFDYGWRVMKANLGFFIGLGFLFMAITFLPDLIRLIIKILQFPSEVVLMFSILLNIVGWIIGVVMGIGLIKIALVFCDGRKPKIGKLFDVAGCFWRYVGTAMLYTLITVGGFLLFIVPGIIWAVKFSLCYYFVIDKGLDPIEALRASSRTTMGVKWQLLGFGIVCGFINLLGVLCLLVGLFATYPTVLMAHALVYRQLMSQTPELRDLGIVTIADEPVTDPQTEQETDSLGNWPSP